MKKKTDPKSPLTPCQMHGHDFQQVSLLQASAYTQFPSPNTVYIFCRKCGEKRQLS